MTNQRRTSLNIVRGFKVLAAVLLFSFGNHALTVLWPPILAGLSGQGINWPAGGWVALGTALVTYGGLTAVAMMWMNDSRSTARQCNRRESSFEAEADQS